MTSSYRLLCLTLVTVLVSAAPALAAGVQARFELSSSSPSGAPFPSNLFTERDERHLTGLRVNLPKPDCAVRPSDCADIDVLNTLDGFNLQPRLAVPFTGAIDVATVSSETVFLVRVGRSGRDHGQKHDHDDDLELKTVGINQVVWEPTTNTLYAESDELLAQHTTYVLIVTRGVRDPAGDRIEASAAFRRLGREHHRSSAVRRYRNALDDALEAIDLDRRDAAVASVFTTQSATAVLEKIRDRIEDRRPERATFRIGSAGLQTDIRTVFPVGDVTSIDFNRQIAAGGALSPTGVPLIALGVLNPLLPVAHIAFGKFDSPAWLTEERFIPPIGTRTGRPAMHGTNEIYFNLFVPAGPKPRDGWPVAIFGHGFGDNKNNSPFVVAASMAANGVATIAINVVGHGRGELGTLVVNRLSGPAVTLPAGGRGIDQDGNGTIDSTEGVNAAPPRGIIGNRDGLRQTVADLMQLVRVIERGMDVDGDGSTDLNRKRIYYFGQSFGGIYGIKFLAVEPSVRVGVPNVPGGPIIDIARISPVFRPLVTQGLGTRVPQLLNALPITLPLFGFNENIPLRDVPPVINNVPGAIAIQEVIENTEWVSQSGNPVAYAPHLRRQPLDDVRAKRIILQFAKGDQTVPNPTTTNILRAGDLADGATYFRNDLVVGAFPTAPKNAHTFLTNIGVPAVAGLSVGAQQQIGIFFASDGETVVDPDGAGLFFEVPIAGALPETLNFIP